MATAGYSGTPLEKKLGLKDGQAVGFAGLPASQKALLKSRAFAYVEQADHWDGFEKDGFDVVHVFTDSADEVNAALPGLRNRIKPDGMIWMSWPKKASKVPTDVTEDTIRDCALSLDLVDVKVCAVDDIWSGLKIVIRKEARAAYAAN
jgi:hypothetical protein